MSTSERDNIVAILFIYDMTEKLDGIITTQLAAEEVSNILGPILRPKEYAKGAELHAIWTKVMRAMHEVAVSTREIHAYGKEHEQELRGRIHE